MKNGFYPASSLDEEDTIRPYEKANDKVGVSSNSETKRIPNSYFSMRDLEGNPISSRPCKNPSDSLRITQEDTDAGYSKERYDFPVKNIDDKKQEKSGKKMSGRKYIVFAAAAFLLCVSILCVVIMTNFQRLSPLERVSDRITSIEEEYVDENGYIAIENAPELIDAVFSMNCSNTVRVIHYMRLLHPMILMRFGLEENVC